MPRGSPDLHHVDLSATAGTVPVVSHHPDDCDLDTCPVIDRIATAIVNGQKLPAGDGRYQAWFDARQRLRLARIGPLPSNTP